MRIAAVVLAAGLAGCAAVPDPPGPLDARPVARSAYCNTPGEAPRVRLLAGPQAVADWQAARSTGLAGDASLDPGATYAVVEHGLRRTGGYGITVTSAALAPGGRLVLQVEFSGPPPDGMATQAFSSPCVLLQLPAGHYRTVELRDAAGAVRATGGFTDAPGERVPESAR